MTSKVVIVPNGRLWPNDLIPEKTANELETLMDEEHRLKNCLSQIHALKYEKHLRHQFDIEKEKGIISAYLVVNI